MDRNSDSIEPFFSPPPNFPGKSLNLSDKGNGERKRVLLSFLPRTDLFSVYGNGASMFPLLSTKVWKRERAKNRRRRRRRRLGKRAIIYFQGGRIRT